MKSKSKKSAVPAKVKSTAAATAPAAKKAGGVEGILSAFGARPETNRAKLLACLARDIGRPVSVTDLLTAVYGKAEADGYGKLSMVIGGALATVAKKKPGYVITKGGERGALAFTMSAKR